MQLYPSYRVDMGIVEVPGVTVTAFTNDEDYLAAQSANINPDMEQSWFKFMFNRVRVRLAANGGEGSHYFPVNAPKVQ